MVVDAGTEFGAEAFDQFLQEHDIVGLRTIAPEAHWQNCRVERHGGIPQSILDKMDQEKPIETEEDLEEALSFATQTKNKWSRFKGYPPEMLVFGKLSKCPGPNSSDDSSAPHELALSESPEGVKFRERLAAGQESLLLSRQYASPSPFSVSTVSSTADCLSPTGLGNGMEKR